MAQDNKYVEKLLDSKLIMSSELSQKLRQSSYEAELVSAICALSEESKMKIEHCLNDIVENMNTSARQDYFNRWNHPESKQLHIVVLETNKDMYYFSNVMSAARELLKLLQQWPEIRILTDGSYLELQNKVIVEKATTLLTKICGFQLLDETQEIEFCRRNSNFIRGMIDGVKRMAILVGDNFESSDINLLYGEPIKTNQLTFRNCVDIIEKELEHDFLNVFTGTDKLQKVLDIETYPVTNVI
jgi:hypothetical protein